MSRLLTLTSVALLLAACSAAPQPAPQLVAAAPDTTNVTRKLQNHWAQCLEPSYKAARAKTIDKNAAAEMAFQACASEEQDLASYVNMQIPIAYSPMPHLKAEMKRLLVEGGDLMVYPEQ
jgi:PBP1b-binding outer membrane lipoprotein LpoB